uniref:Uncharacterized protein n=1 Tax=Anguilla anguilla TaxID=7936 RepID=A0A0E9XKC0_ANGAN
MLKDEHLCSIVSQEANSTEQHAQCSMLHCTCSVAFSNNKQVAIMLT